MKAEKSVPKFANGFGATARNPVRRLPKGKGTMASADGVSLTDLLVTRFNKLERLSETERGFLRLIEGRAKQTYTADSRLLSEGGEIRAPHFILTGWAAQVRELPEGRRQIISVLMAGDIIGLWGHARPLSPTSVVALTSMHTVAAPEIPLAWRDLNRDRVPNLSRALDLAVAEQEFFLINHITRLGRQTAHERLASWVTELEYRLLSRGLSTNGAFAFPLTQEMIADINGMSVVHVNRVLQQMRRDGHIDLSRGRLAILDREALLAAGQFKPPRLSAGQIRDDKKPDSEASTSE